MQQLRDLWQGGYEGQHIEELIGSVFADFAPYAGADQQRLIFSRQHDTEAVTSLIVEDNGDYGVSCTHRHAGTVSFTSTGELQAQLALRLPLIPITPQTWWAQQQEKQKQRGVSNKGSASLLQPQALHHVPPQLTTTQPITEASLTDTKTLAKNKAVVHHPLRFTSYERGAYLLTGLPHTIASAHRNGLGQLELDGVLPSLWQGRHSYGVRCGPLATRLAVTPHSEQVAQTSSVMSNEDESALGRTLQHQQYTFDTALCIPFAPSAQEASQGKDTGHWALSLGMQHPEPYGDTLIALALQNRRMAPCAPQQSVTNTLSSAIESIAQDRKRETTTITSNDNANVSVDIGKTRPSIGFRVLLVQTLLSRTLLAPDASLLSQDDETSATLRDLSQRIVSADKPWYSLPTLIGCNVSALHDLVRCSAAAIFHDNAVDLETALVVDATPLVPHTPSLLRVGWNNTGRVAVGITSLVGQALSITLGIDYTRGETPRFGIDLHA